MIHQIAVPIYRTISEETAFLEKAKFGTTDNPDHPNNVIAAWSKDAITELDKYLSDGYTIVDTFMSDNRTTTYRTYVLHKLDKPVAAGMTAGAAVRLVDSITKKQTWSKSTSQYFHFWKCSFPEGGFVNIFDHPDANRNTFKLCVQSGWKEIFESLDLDGVACLREFVPMVVSNDGEWNKLDNIITFEDFTAAHQWGFDYEDETDE